MTWLLRLVSSLPEWQLGVGQLIDESKELANLVGLRVARTAFLEVHSHIRIGWVFVNHVGARLAIENEPVTFSQRADVVEREVLRRAPGLCL